MGGARLVAVYDHPGAIAKPSGIDPYDLNQYVVSRRKLVAYPGGTAIDHTTFLSMKWELEEVDTKLSKRMMSAYERVHNAAKAYGVDWRTVAYIVGLRRLEKVYKERGIFP